MVYFCQLSFNGGDVNVKIYIGCGILEVGQSIDISSVFVTVNQRVENVIKMMTNALWGTDSVAFGGWILLTHTETQTECRLNGHCTARNTFEVQQFSLVFSCPGLTRITHLNFKSDRAAIL